MCRYFWWWLWKWFLQGDADSITPWFRRISLRTHRRQPPAVSGYQTTSSCKAWSEWGIGYQCWLGCHIQEDDNSNHPQLSCLFADIQVPSNDMKKNTFISEVGPIPCKHHREAYSIIQLVGNVGSITTEYSWCCTSWMVYLFGTQTEDPDWGKK
jgi:hypothetical protein